MRHVPAISRTRDRGVAKIISKNKRIAALTSGVTSRKLSFPNLSSCGQSLVSAVSIASAIPSRALRKWIEDSEAYLNLLREDPQIKKPVVIARDKVQVSGRGGKAVAKIKAPGKTETELPIGRNRMKSYVQFITTPTSDTPGTALLLHFDDKRYIVGNVHEGLQRAGLQIGSRFFKVKDFFLTGRTEWKTNGGLLGMILTLADAANTSAAARAEALKAKTERARRREEEEQRRSILSKKASTDSIYKLNAQAVEEDPTVTIHGGPNLIHTLATARSFVFRRGTPIKVIETHQEHQASAIDFDREPDWSDKRIQVWTMAICPPSSYTASSTSRPSSPRKRSLGEFMTGERPKTAEVADQWSIQSGSSEIQAERDQKLREFVVSEMFSSKWRYDNLVETPLHQVKMPAALFVRDRAGHKIERYNGPVPDGTTPIPNISVLVRQPWPGALVDRLPPAKHSAIAISYIFQNHKQRGRFRPSAAKALKIPTGPLWAALAAGENITLEDGKVITPEMVLEPSKDGNGFAIVDLPSREYVENLIHRPEWKAQKPMNGVGAIIWLLGKGVAHDETLIAFMKEHSTLKHIMSGPDHCPDYLTMTSAASAAINHHQIDPARYLIPVHANNAPTSPRPLLGEPGNGSIAWLPAKRGLKLQLEPKFVLEDNEVIPHLDTALVVRELPQEVIRLGQKAQSEISKSLVDADSPNVDLPGQDAEIICLGTGSALPSQHRNVSASLLRVPGYGSYLIDCGENTLGQLKRIYSESELAEVWRDLKMIWISHLHADHHLGTASVVKAWYKEVHGRDITKRPRPSLTEQLLAPGKFLEEGKRLFVVGHRNMLRWLDEYSSVEEFGYNQLIPLEPIPANRSNPDHGSLEWNGMQVGFNVSKDSWVKSAMRKATGLSNLVAASVNHCYGAMAVSMTFPSGFKFSYSGDCRPSKDFAVIGRGTTLLLHEATFDDELQGDALAKKHSTTSEAIGVGAAMGARRVILTHFSQRYQKIPAINSMNSLNVTLEDAEPSEDSADAPVDEAMAPAVEAKDPIIDSVESSEVSAPQPPTEAPSQDIEGPAQALTNATTGAFSSLTNFSTLLQPPPKPTPLDMKIGVAFDYMRVRVGDIIHLEKFNPAMRELYKESEEEEKAKKAKAIAHADTQSGITPAVIIDGNQKQKQQARAKIQTQGNRTASMLEAETEKEGETYRLQNREIHELEVWDGRPEKEMKIRESLSLDPSILVEQYPSAQRDGSKPAGSGSGENRFRIRRSQSRSPDKAQRKAAAAKSEGAVAPGVEDTAAKGESAVL